MGGFFGTTVLKSASTAAPYEMSAGLVRPLAPLGASLTCGHAALHNDSDPSGDPRQFMLTPGTACWLSAVITAFHCGRIYVSSLRLAPRFRSPPQVIVALGFPKEKGACRGG